MLKSAFVVGVLALCASAPALADQCIGSVVNGQCVGVIQRDYSNPGGRPADSFYRSGRGYHTSPNAGVELDGGRLRQYNQPIIQPGLGLRWKDRNE